MRWLLRARGAPLWAVRPCEEGLICVDGNTFRRVLLARAAFRGVVTYFGGLLYLGATTLDRIKRLEDSNAAMALKLDTVNKEVVAAN